MRDKKTPKQNKTRNVKKRQMSKNTQLQTHTQILTSVARGSSVSGSITGAAETIPFLFTPAAMFTVIRHTPGERMRKCVYYLYIKKVQVRTQMLQHYSNSLLFLFNSDSDEFSILNELLWACSIAILPVLSLASRVLKLIIIIIKK